VFLVRPVRADEASLPRRKRRREAHEKHQLDDAEDRERSRRGVARDRAKQKQRDFKAHLKVTTKNAALKKRESKITNGIRVPGRLAHGWAPAARTAILRGLVRRVPDLSSIQKRVLGIGGVQLGPNRVRGGGVWTEFDFERVFGVHRSSIARAVESERGSDERGVWGRFGGRRETWGGWIEKNDAREELRVEQVRSEKQRISSQI
tara:strand:+ start:3900 stop:4514 length:615 start_codon:yes stop_codon:yes gene_type:complete